MPEVIEFHELSTFYVYLILKSVFKASAYWVRDFLCLAPQLNLLDTKVNFRGWCLLWLGFFFILFLNSAYSVPEINFRGRCLPWLDFFSSFCFSTHIIWHQGSIFEAGACRDWDFSFMSCPNVQAKASRVKRNKKRNFISTVSILY